MIEELDFAEIDELLDRLAAQHRRGEPVLLPPEVEANPALATRVKQLLNTMLAMEGAAAPFPSAKPKKKRVHAPIDSVGGYRIIREIGRGGMGVVYEAEQLALGRRVALKVLPDYSLDDPVAVERFQREARAVARLHHTNIVPVFEVGRDGQRFFFAMQLIAGCGLDRLIDLRRTRTASIGRPTPRTAQTIEEAKALPGIGGAIVQAPALTDVGVFSNASNEWGSTTNGSSHGVAPIVMAPEWLASIGSDYYRAVASIGAQTAAALDHAHSRGVVHRDVKPSNLLVDESGIVWITDFGLAKTDDNDLTRPNAILGTVRYMAPERFCGHGDSRSDIYSLGVTLYELAALRPPFLEHDQMELIHAISKSEPPPLHSINPAIPRDYETIVLKAMEKEPDRRYQTGAELRADLDRFIADEPIHARRASTIDRLARWCRREPAVASLTASMAALLVLFAAYWVASARRLQVELDRVAELKASETAAKNAANARVVELQLERSRESRMGVDAGRRKKSLQAIAEAASTPGDEPRRASALAKLRDEAIAALSQFDLERIDGAIALAETDTLQTLGVAFDQTLDRFAVVDGDGIALKRRSQRGVDVRLPHRSDNFTEARCDFSPSGRFIAAEYRAGTDGQLRTAVWALEHDPRNVCLRDGSCAWLKRDRLLCHESSTGTLSIIEPSAGGQPSWRAPWRLRERKSWTVAPDESLLAVWGETERWVALLRLADGTESARLELDAAASCAAWSPDCRHLAIGLSNGECVVWNVAANKRQTKLVGHRSVATRIAFHPNGNVVATCAPRESTRFWNIANGKALLALPADFSRFSVDGRLLATQSGGAAALWSVADSDTEVGLHVDPVVAATGNRAIERLVVDFSHDESIMACTQRGGVRFYDCGTFREIGVIGCKQVSYVAFDTAGKCFHTFGLGCSHRWPLRQTTEAGGVRWSFGPPEPQHRPQGGTLSRSVMAEDRRSIVVPVPGGREAAWIDLDRPTTRKLYGSIWWFNNVAISSNSRWIAGSGLKSNQVQVWETAQGRPIATLECAPARPTDTGVMAFSPDDDLLVTQNQEVIFWDTKTWKRAAGAPIIPTRLAEVAPVFSRRDRLLAIALSNQEIGLFDARDFTRRASLQVAELSGIQTMTFSRHGTYLAVSSPDQQVRVWRMNNIQSRLGELHLDWRDEEDASPALAAGAASADPRATTMEVIGPSLVDPTLNAYHKLAKSWLAPVKDPAAIAAVHFDRSQAWQTLRRPDKVMQELDAALAVDPTHADALHARAVQHAEARRLDRALADADAALAVRPNDSEALFLRARLRARQREWTEAEADYDRLGSWSRSDNFLRMMRAQVLLHAGKAGTAADELELLFAGYFEDNYFVDSYLRALFRTGDAKRIDAGVRSVTGANAVIADIHSILAWAMVCGPQETRRPAEALGFAHKAVLAKPSDAAALNALALVNLRLGRIDDAALALEKRRLAGKTRLNGNESIVQALCHIEKGRFNQARRDIAAAANYRNRSLSWRQAFEAAELTLLIDEANAKLEAKTAKVRP